MRLLTNLFLFLGLPVFLLAQPDLTLWIADDSYHDHIGEHHNMVPYPCDSSYYIYYSPDPDQIEIILKNEGTSLLTIESIDISSIEGASFSTSAELPVSIEVDEMMTLVVDFQLPESYVDGINGSAMIYSNDPGGVCSISFDVGIEIIEPVYYQLEIEAIQNDAGGISIESENQISINANRGIYGEFFEGDFITATGDITTQGRFVVEDEYSLPDTIGSVGQILQVNSGSLGGIVEWSDPSGGAFENVSGIVRSTGDHGTDDFVFGRDALPENGEEIIDTFLFFDKSNGAFRAGAIGTAISLSPDWSPDSIGSFSFASGLNTKAIGYASTAMGRSIEAIGDYSTAMGFYTVAHGKYSAAMGNGTKAIGKYSTAMGGVTKAEGEYSTSMGRSTKAKGSTSTAMGHITEAIGEYSTAMGRRTKANGSTSTAMGYIAEAIGDYSTAMGHITDARGYASTAMGFNTISNGYAGTVIGMYNNSLITGQTSVTPETPLFIIGNGDGTNNRSNAMVVRKDGNSYFSHDLTIDPYEGDARLVLDARAANNALEFRINGGYKGAFGWDYGNDRMFIYTGGNAAFFSNGRVGIGGREASTNALEVGGNASKSTSGSWLANSDQRLKKNIVEINPTQALNQVRAMRGVTYEWDDEVTGYDRPEGNQIGFIAQDIEQIFPEKVSKDELGYLQTAYGDYDPLFVQAIKELAKRVEQLEKEVYNGNVVLDENGEAVVEMADWFSALNMEYRYQLTCIGGFAQVYIAEEISDNQFRIAGGTSGLKVSWQVTGIRQDPYARMNRVKVEEMKPQAERGTYLHPKAYGMQDYSSQEEY